MAPRQGCASWNGEILKKKIMKSIVWPQRSVSNQWSSPSSDYKKFHITLATASEHHHTPGGSGAWAAWPHTASLSRGLNGAIVERRCTGRDSSGIDGGLLCFRGKKWIKIVSLKEYLDFWLNPICLKMIWARLKIFGAPRTPVSPRNKHIFSTP